METEANEDTNIRVAVRCRPFNSKEKLNNESSCFRINDETVVLINPNDSSDVHNFAFDIG